MRKVRRIRRQGQDVELIAEQLAAVPASAAAIDTKVALIQLIPLGLLHVQESLQQEVERLAGARYAREGGKPGVVRYGKQPGSIYLADLRGPAKPALCRFRALGSQKQHVIGGLAWGREQHRPTRAMPWWVA